MAIGSKIRTASRILMNDGIVAFLRALKQRMGKIAFLEALKQHLAKRDEARRPDEHRIVFEALNADKSTGLMLDVGAHHGGALSSFALNGWQVFAFEPDSENRKELASAFGGLPNVVIDSRAVSDHTQEKAVLYRSEQSTGISGLAPFHSSHQVGEEVDVTTLERVLDEQGIAHKELTFLKIDTEGFDLHVLRGFPWHKASPRLILCEFEDAKTVPLGYTFHDLAGFLVEHGYRLIVSEWCPIERYGVPHDWKRFARYPCEPEDPKAWGNILATKEDGIYDSLLHICRLDP